MARLSALPEDTALVTNDYVPIVKASGPTTKRTTLATMIEFFFQTSSIPVGSSTIGVSNANLNTTAGDIGGAWVEGNPNATGFSSKTADSFVYTKIGKTVIGRLTIAGASNATTLTFTLPFVSALSEIMIAFQADNNSVRVATPAKISLTAGSAVATCLINPSDGAWTASNNKAIGGMLIFQSTT